MRRLYIILLAICALWGCDSELYDDKFAEVQKEIDALNQRLDVFCAEANSNLDAIHSLVEMGITQNYIKDVVPVKEGGKLIGYDIVFTQADPVRIYSGRDGENGPDGLKVTTPAITVAKADDGLLYWQSGGQWLLNGEGKMMRAEAVVPLLKIEERCWYVSYDKGNTWTLLGKAVGKDGEDGKDGKDGEDGENGKNGEDGEDGEDGHSVFVNVKLTSTDVIFTLIGGEVFSLPRHNKLDVKFEIEGEEVNVLPGAEVKVRYTLVNASELTKVSVSSDGNYKVRLEKLSESSGIVYIACPTIYKDGYVNFILSDGNGYLAIKVLNLYESRIEVNDGLEYRIPAEGGKIRVPYTSNFEYSIEVAPESRSWLSFVKTKAETVESEIEIVADANEEASNRVGNIYIQALNSDTIFAEIVINQASMTFSIDKVNHSVPVEGASVSSMITSHDGLSLKLPEGAGGWMSYEIVKIDDERYELVLKTYANYGSERIIDIMLYNESGDTYLGKIQISQKAMEEEKPEYMVFVVKTFIYSDGMVYLPLAGNLDCIIDWGDETQEVVKRSITSSSSDKVSHKYDVQVPKEFVVRISGKVPQLSSYNMPLHSVVEVKQWGKTGLESLDYAFCNNGVLRSIATDKVGSFEKVTTCSNMFNYCVNLVALPDGLLEYCKSSTSCAYFCSNATSLQYVPAGLFAGMDKVTAFNNVFEYCPSLLNVTGNLFEGCKAVTTFANAFQHCTSLTEIPEGFFDSCPMVTTFYYTFWNCTSLTQIPVSLFDNQRLVRTFETTFNTCTKLIGESPYTIIEGEKVHLYERELYPDYFVRPEGVRCFLSDKNLLDYASIPSPWR